MDLDGFKAVNDRLGHEAGDELLRKVAGSLLASARKSDVVARFGGDEFVLLSPYTDTVAARRLAQRIETAIAGSHELASGTVVIGASVGFAVGRHGLDSADELLRKADDAMYAVKAHHRHESRREG